MYGAWGDATLDGKTLQMRALDWDTSGPFQDYPQVTVYHKETASVVVVVPSPEEMVATATEQSFANVGWTGWIGSITGMSEVNTAISEIGVSFPDATFGKESRFGVPFTFILRDILQFDRTLDDAMDHITNAYDFFFFFFFSFLQILILQNNRPHSHSLRFSSSSSSFGFPNFQHDRQPSHMWFDSWGGWW